jgi:DHA1 family inner membrane transport protein
MRLPILALAVASFAIGTTEFVIIGLLPEVAASFRVSIADAGLLVTYYALAVTIGAPFLAIGTARLPRRTTLLLLMVMFIVGNILCAIAPTYLALMGARIITALAHGAFFGIGSVVASQLVPRHQRARAIALMFTGLTLANVLGVPLGTILGQAAGWRAAFWAVGLIGILAALATHLWVPALPADRDTNIFREFRTLRRGQVLWAMLISMLSSVSLFSVFTYITPLLETVAAISPAGVGIALLLLGVGLTGGNLIGGRLADWRLMPSVMGVFAVLAAVLLVLHFTVLHAMPAMVTLVIWGAVAFALVSPLQMRVVAEAVDAPNLAATLNQGAFNFGNATGAWLGGLVIAGGLGYRALPLLGAGVALLGLLATACSYAMERRSLAPV